jgi:hypothetical protein
MPVPPNQTAATAIDIGTLTGYTPYTTVQDAFDSGAGASVALWYSYLPVAGDDVLEVYAYGNGTTYFPVTTIRSGPAPANILLDNTSGGLSRPMQQDIVTFVTPGERVFFRFLKSSGNVNPSPTTIRIARGQKELILNHDLFINDSSPGWPGVVMDPATAIPKRYALNYPAGEGQMVLRNGIVGVIDAFNVLGIVLYDVTSSGFTVRATPTMPDTHYTRALGTNQVDTFWLLRRFGVSNAFALSVDQDGVVGTPLDLGNPSFNDITPQADNGALYGVVGTEIRKVTNPGGVVTTFLTVDAGFAFGANIMMMTDDTLLVPYEKAATTSYIKRFDLSATLLNTFTLTGVVNSLERIFADPDDPNYFWIWWQTATLNRFQKIQVSDGSVVVDLSRMKFVNSVSQTTLTAGDTVYSGADFSCVPIVLRLSATPVGVPGCPAGLGLQPVSGPPGCSPALQ